MSEKLVEKKKGLGPAPTVQQIQSDYVTQLANQYWAPYSTMPKLAFNPKVSRAELMMQTSLYSIIRL